MPLSSELISFEARIENLLDRADAAALVDGELASSLARFACVLTSGYLEVSVRVLVGAWCCDKAHPHVHAYVGRQLDWFSNPKLGKILDLLSHFSAPWRDGLEAALTDEEKDAINSVVSNRHHIAHGRNVGLSPVPMRRYLVACKSAVRRLDNVINPPQAGVAVLGSREAR
jgi:hypothetical protein